ncbi:hypothetical protein AB1N83_012972 [Pleurotus pulmonarius]
MRCPIARHNTPWKQRLPRTKPTYSGAVSNSCSRRAFKPSPILSTPALHHAIDRKPFLRCIDAYFVWNPSLQRRGVWRNHWMRGARGDACGDAMPRGGGPCSPSFSPYAQVCCPRGYARRRIVHAERGCAKKRKVFGGLLRDCLSNGRRGEIRQKAILGRQYLSRRPRDMVK